MKIKDLKESITTELFDVNFNDYNITINIDFRKIHKLSGSDERIYKLLSDFDTKVALDIERLYDKEIKELAKETEIELAEITDSYVTILQAVMLEFKNKKEQKLKELKDEFKRKR